MEQPCQSRCWQEGVLPYPFHRHKVCVYGVHTLGLGERVAAVRIGSLKGGPGKHMSSATFVLFDALFGRPQYVAACAV